MRAMILLMGLAVVGCASQPSSPAADLVAQSPAGAEAGTPTDVEAQRLTTARKLNFKVIDKNGMQLFCRSNEITASRIQRYVTCYTAEQLDNIHAQMEREFDRQNLRPTQSPGLTH